MFDRDLEEKLNNSVEICGEKSNTENHLELLN